MNNIIVLIVISAIIGGLVADVFLIITKLVLFVALSIAKNDARISLRNEIWIAGILTFILAFYFIAV